MGARVIGGAVLLLLLASCEAVCGAVPAASIRTERAINCVDAKAAHHAYVVVQHGSGAWIERCVGFGPGFIDAPTLMGRAGISYTWLESTLCAVDGEPATAAPCPPNETQRWAVFVTTADRWSMTSEPFDSVRIADRQALGLRYVAASDRTPGRPPLTNRLPG